MARSTESVQGRHRPGERFVMEASEVIRTTDLHAHIVPPVIASAVASGRLHGVDLDLTAEGRLRAVCGGAQAVLPWPDFAESLMTRLAAMDEARIERHVLSMSPLLFWYAASVADAVPYARAVNDSLAAVVREAPDRFRAFAYLPLQDPTASVAELERCMADDAFAGAVVGTNVQGRDWDAPELEPILAAAARLGALLFIHPTRVRGTEFMDRYHLRNLIGNPLETALAFAALTLGGALDRNPGLRLLLAHGGGFASAGVGRLDHGARVREENQGLAGLLPSEHLRNVHIDCLTHSEASLRYLIDAVGVNRVVLGTDYPADMGLKDPIGWLEGMPWLSEEDRTAIAGGNASVLLDGKNVGSRV